MKGEKDSGKGWGSESWRMWSFELKVQNGQASNFSPSGGQNHDPKILSRLSRKNVDVARF